MGFEGWVGGDQVEQERRDIPSTGNRRSKEREVHGASAGGLGVLRRP